MAQIVQDFDEPQMQKAYIVLEDAGKLSLEEFVKLSVTGVDPDVAKDLARGKIHSVFDAQGNTVSFEYADDGRLVVIRDALDQHLWIVYNADGGVALITDFAGRAWLFD